MKAQLLYKPQPVGNNPLQLDEIERPEPKPDEVRIKVNTCGVCHTDLHVVEGDLTQPALPIIPGHEVVGVIDSVGEHVRDLQIGARVGAFWMHDTCGKCLYCQNDLENLCDAARFTGYTANGGYAEYMVVPSSFVVPIPDVFNDIETAPLLCAGIVGYRSLILSDLKPGERLGLFGFGGSAHICIQVARHWDCEVYVFTRSQEHQNHARELGAVWVGEATDQPPVKLDRAIIFAPAGWIIPEALTKLRKGGTLAVNAIHMSDIPSFAYDPLWHERTIRSVANTTRHDAREFMALAAQIPIYTQTSRYDLDDANHVLQQLKNRSINGAAVLTV